MDSSYFFKHNRLNRSKKWSPSTSYKTARKDSIENAPDWLKPKIATEVDGGTQWLGEQPGSRNPTGRKSRRLAARAVREDTNGKSDIAGSTRGPSKRYHGFARKFWRVWTKVKKASLSKRIRSIEG